MSIRIWGPVAAIGVAFALFSSASRAAEPLTVAYIDHVYPAGTKLSDAVRVERLGRLIPITGSTMDLASGDRVLVSKTTNNVRIVTVRYLANNTVVAVRDDLTVQRPSLPGLGGTALALLKATFGTADQSGTGAAMAASRGITTGGSCFNETGRTDDPTSFNVPILAATKSQIVAGSRALFVSWRGGGEPFTVTLADAATDAVITQSTKVRNECSVRLPQTELRPGRYRLTVVDANNVKEQEDSLFVVSQSPSMPAELRDAPISSEARQIYFATWLAAIDQGEWAFEAQQLVAGMECRSAAVQEWLGQWGGVPPCSATGK